MGAVPLYVNRRLMLEFLSPLVSTPGADNKLETWLWRHLSSKEVVALLRACTLFQLLFSGQMRWLSGKHLSLESWSPVSEAEVLNLAEGALQSLSTDGSKLFDPAFDPFAPIAAKQPAFRQWRDAQLQRTAAAPDGTKHRLVEHALNEARAPTTAAGNEVATAVCVEIIEQMAKKGIEKLHSNRTALQEKLSSQGGAEAPEKQAAKHAATVGAHTINDHVESNFGSCAEIHALAQPCISPASPLHLTPPSLYGRYGSVAGNSRYAAVEHVSGVAQQMRMGDFDGVAPILSDRRKRKATEAEPPAQAGFFHRMAEPLKHSLIETGRIHRADARAAGRAALVAHDEAKLARREERTITLLNAAVEAYACASQPLPPPHLTSSTPRSFTPPSPAAAGMPKSCSRRGRCRAGA